MIDFRPIELADKERVQRYTLSSWRQNCDLSFAMVNKWKCIVADEEFGKTTKEGVYAGGDAVTGAATVILAMGAGKAGAKGIDEYLSNK